MLRYLTIILILLSCQLSFAQKEGYIWTFGDSAAIDFNGGNPVPLFGTGLASLECSSTISDSNGNILFYAGINAFFYNYDEVIVFNRYNKIIDNGTGIYGNYSSTQGCLLIPDPGDTNMIYLFTHKQDASISDLKMYYSIIDKSANSDSGAVILKNFPFPGIHSLMTEQLQAVKHGNGKDWWLLMHRGSTNHFYVYLLDSSGIHAPFIQAVGNIFSTISGTGQLTVSPDGSKVAIVVNSGIIDIFDFDRCTGTLSNLITLGDNSSSIVFNHNYGGSFSPSSQILYISKVDSGLFQYNLQAVDIKASRQLIWTKPDTSGHIGQHLLGPDGKIYIANCKPLNTTPGVFNLENMNLSVINSPDSLGLACDFQPYSFNLGGRRSFYGLPNIPEYKLGESEGACVVSVSEDPDHENNISFYPNPTTSELNIQFTLTESKNVKLQLFNSLGQNVKTISTEKLNVGENKINLSTEDISPGIYFLKFTSGDKSLTRKVVKM